MPALPHYRHCLSPDTTCLHYLAPGTACPEILHAYTASLWAQTVPRVYSPTLPRSRHCLSPDTTCLHYHQANPLDSSWQPLRAPLKSVAMWKLLLRAYRYCESPDGCLVWAYRRSSSGRPQGVVLLFPALSTCAPWCGLQNKGPPRTPNHTHNTHSNFSKKIEFRKLPNLIPPLNRGGGGVKGSRGCPSPCGTHTRFWESLGTSATRGGFSPLCKDQETQGQPSRSWPWLLSPNFATHTQTHTHTHTHTRQPWLTAVVGIGWVQWRGGLFVPTHERDILGPQQCPSSPPNWGASTLATT